MYNLNTHNKTKQYQSSQRRVAKFASRPPINIWYTTNQEVLLLNFSTVDAAQSAYCTGSMTFSSPIGLVSHLLKSASNMVQNKLYKIWD